MLKVKELKYVSNGAVPELRQSVVGFPLQRLGFCTYGICGEQSDTGIDFLRVLRFPHTVIAPTIDPHSLIILYKQLKFVSTVSWPLYTICQYFSFCHAEKRERENYITILHLVICWRIKKSYSYIHSIRKPLFEGLHCWKHLLGDLNLNNLLEFRTLQRETVCSSRLQKYIFKYSVLGDWSSNKRHSKAIPGTHITWRNCIPALDSKSHDA
jgi:hypothetical protein